MIWERKYCKATIRFATAVHALELKMQSFLFSDQMVLVKSESEKYNLIVNVQKRESEKLSMKMKRTIKK